MGRVLALDLDPDTVDELRARLASVENVSLDATTQAEGLRSLDADPDTVEVLVVGNHVPDPVQTAQRAFVVLPQLPVLILTSSLREREVRGALQFAPLIGDNVRCVIKDEGTSPGQVVGDALQQSRRRARHRATVSALNVKLDAGAIGRTLAPTAALLGRILERAPVGIAVTDGAGVVTALNAFGARLLGTSEQRSMGTQLQSLLAVDEAEAWRAFLGRLDVGDQAPAEEFTTAASNSADLEVTGAPLTGRDGAPGYVILLRDITEHNRLVESERHARHDAEAASRAKDEFLAMLGHELRNPLSPIVTALQLMRMRGEEPRFAREHAIIERQVHHLVRLVDDLLDISRITRGTVELHKERVEVASFVAKAIEQAAPLIEQRAQRLEVRVPATGLRVDVDPVRLAQVVANLLTNAAKYGSHGGLIEVTAEAVEGDVEVRVRDEGIGMKAEMLPRVFDTFVQGERGLDRALGGLGLGLAIVRNIVGLHGGSVDARSAGVGHGSTFTVRLPAGLGEPATPPTVPAATSAAAVAVADLKVLLVDDNVDAVEMLALVLEDCGFDIRIAHDGHAALHEAQSFEPDVCVLDIGLPGMSGHELAKRLRARAANEHAHLVALTGFGQPSDRARSIEAGFEHHLVKPVDIGELRSLLQGYAARRSKKPAT